MLAFYFFGSIGLIVGIYAIVERKRLLACRRIALMKERGETFVKFPFSIQNFAEFMDCMELADMQVGTTIAFKYRASHYIAIPLGEDEALISRIEDAA